MFQSISRWLRDRLMKKGLPEKQAMEVVEKVFRARAGLTMQQVRNLSGLELKERSGEINPETDERSFHKSAKHVLWNAALKEITNRKKPDWKQELLSL